MQTRRNMMATIKAMHARIRGLKKENEIFRQAQIESMQRVEAEFQRLSARFVKLESTMTLLAGAGILKSLGGRARKARKSK